MSQIIQIKGTAMRKEAFFYKKKHPTRFKIMQAFKKFVKFISFGYANIHYTYK
jgi:hypothetical protein